MFYFVLNVLLLLQFYIYIIIICSIIVNSCVNIGFDNMYILCCVYYEMFIYVYIFFFYLYVVWKYEQCWVYVYIVYIYNFCYERLILYVVYSFLNNFSIISKLKCSVVIM